ncbi:MAG: hypothetical protein MHM6MM_009541, partial [Cercozoa sp. M6MM]
MGWKHSAWENPMLQGDLALRADLRRTVVRDDLFNRFGLQGHPHILEFARASGERKEYTADKMRCPRTLAKVTK